MQKILLIKTSSLGDIIHTLPALTDALTVHPNLQFDWLIEQSFAEIPRLHPAVKRIIPIAFREWRRGPFQAWHNQHWQHFYKALRNENYDLIIDAQGLLKSALLGMLARSKIRCGLDWSSARESLASLFYQRKCHVNFQQQAVVRVRQLFAQALAYAVPDTAANYGLAKTGLPTRPVEPYIIFLHGTTWKNKHWPEHYWIALANQVSNAGINILLPWGNAQEQARAERIAKAIPRAEVLSQSSLLELINLLSHARAAIAVDTGLGHLAAALAVPTISLYGPTDPAQTGTVGQNQYHVAAQFPCAPCLKRSCNYSGPTSVTPACLGTISPVQVWQRLQNILLNTP